MDIMKRKQYLRNASKALKDGQYTQALGFLTFALKYSQDDKSQIAHIKEEMAQVYIKLKNNQKARTYAMASLELYQWVYSRNKSQDADQGQKRMSKLLETMK